MGAWFGDDLTDPDLPPIDTPAISPPDGTTVRGATSLVVACWPLDARDGANRTRLAWLLRPGGHLVLVVAVSTGTTATPEAFSPLAQAAANAGLGYLQHIVAVGADTDATHSYTTSPTRNCSRWRTKRPGGSGQGARRPPRPQPAFARPCVGAGAAPRWG